MLSGRTHNGGFQERIICYILYKDDDYIAFLFRNKSILILILILLSGVSKAFERFDRWLPVKKIIKRRVPLIILVYCNNHLHKHKLIYKNILLTNTLLFFKIQILIIYVATC